ncbi:hypothetical protein EK21DRAFT_80850 [Setomelanomma holmii]|uniref:Uncharacterized protein n=1 Tax=Setomelanomma holmii TaxID=210430 RepID=A0A9P4GV58_9PLEO|nr:hypothetical protein EK21DRAFT_80850 [Setomelanomma holmii]
MSSASGPNTTVQPAGTANISIREYIYFLPHPLPPNTPVPYSIHLPTKNPLNLPATQFEPTSTLVLTSLLNTFVDIRLFTPRHPDELALPNHGERDRLEWAFAGSSLSVPIADPHVSKPGTEKPWANVSKSTWTHWLDSRFHVGSKVIPVDEGLMYLISATQTLEHGYAFHPSLGKVAGHEEMWRDVAVLPTGSGAKGKKVCVVMRLHNDAVGARGVIVRLGQYCQGIVMLGKYSTIERWEFGGGEGGGSEKDGGWKRTARVGDQFLPCSVTWREEIVRVGAKVKYHDYEWAVEEAWEW